jgi:5'-nucleotidase
MKLKDRFQWVPAISLGLALAMAGCSDDPQTGTGGAGGDGGAGGSTDAVLRILVTNDDGVMAEGIDALVEGLRENPKNDITVCAPDVNKSSSGDQTTPTPPPLEAVETTTASGYPATAVDGFPADSVIYALENLYPGEPPHVVLSGINDGQNVGDVVVTGTLGLLVDASGTVGAAKTAACLGVPALASSQGNGDVIDFPAGVTAVLSWLEQNRAALAAGEVSVETIAKIDIPSCDSGEIRGTLEVPLATENPNGWLLSNGEQDCESTVENPPNDVEAFFNGFIPLSPVPRNKFMTCDKLE